MKVIKWLLISILTIFFLILLAKPINLYREHMDAAFSLKNSDWGDFGSFIGGVYGSIFSSITLVVVLITSYKTNKASKEQLMLIKNEQHFTNFSKLLEHLKANYITTYNGIGGKNSIEDFYKRLEVWLGLAIKENYNKNLTLKENLISYAIIRFETNPEEQDLFKKEAKLFKCIIDVIQKSPGELADAMKVIFENTFSETERFSLSTYTHAHYPKTRAFLLNWPSLTIVPPASYVQAQLNLEINKIEWKE
ncbi:hypothetical protein [Kosakonia sacchari]|uniref:hypothetical protein n=1 Tax=Kosakonia sacchari TaxID=1158459 RepID=UPI001363CCA3|nr:hypothetical protein [Kosakonia sacchari]QHM93306.1 hypothetical protein FGE25_03050 [Kosakonia sacchari]